MATLHAQHQKAHGEPSGFPPQGQHGNHRALVSCGKYPRSGGTSARLQAIKADHEFLRDCSLESCSVGVGN